MNNCGNGTDCVNTIGGYTCRCQEGYREPRISFGQTVCSGISNRMPTLPLIPALQYPIHHVRHLTTTHPAIVIHHAPLPPFTNPHPTCPSYPTPHLTSSIHRCTPDVRQTQSYTQRPPYTDPHLTSATTHTPYVHHITPNTSLALLTFFTA